MIIDLTYINSIADDDNDTKRQLIELFVSQAEEIRTRFLKAQADNDTDEISRIAHLAKSTTKVMGINIISDAMLELQSLTEEHKSPEKYNDLIQIFMDNIPTAINELQEEVRKL